MASVEKELRLRIADNLGHLAESVLRRVPPFDQIPLHPEVSRTYRKLYEYWTELDQELRTKVLEREITWSRFNIKDGLVRSNIRFNDLYPEYKMLGDTFVDWIRSRESGHVVEHRTLSHSPLKKASVNQMVKQLLKQRMPHFKTDNKAFGSIGISKPWSFGNKLYLLLDTGTWRSSLSFSIALDFPGFCLDLAQFFGRSQSHFAEGYHSDEEIGEGVNKALNLIDLLMPYFEKAVQKAFEAP